LTHEAGLPQRRVGLDATADLDAAEGRHLQVQQRDVGLQLADRRERGRAVGDPGVSARRASAPIARRIPRWWTSLSPAGTTVTTR
jgi:hypothetical protein